MKEIICIHIGEAGIRIGQQFWELVMREHGIGKDGRIMEEEKRGNPQVLFYEDENNVFIPRALFCDHDSMAIEELVKTDIGQLLKPDQLVFGKESACYFSKGHFSYNNEFLDRCQSLIARLIEECTNLDCILFFYSLSGGTGTGFGSRLLQIFSTSFGKIHKVAISILPSEDNSSLIIEPYNFVLGFHDLIEHLDFNICFDNQSLYKICNEKLKIEQPTFCDINRLICKHVSSVYSSIRFSSQDAKINENTFVSMQSETGCISTQKILANCVPYYRMHFLLPSFSPFIAEIDSHKVVHSVESISASVLNSGSYMAYFDENYSKSIGSMLSYKGDVQYSDIVKTLPDVREKINLFEWAPTGVLCSLTNNPCVSYEDEAPIQRSVAFINNSISIAVNIDRATQKFDRLYGRNAFMHWIYSNGIERGDFDDSRENIAALIKDYEETTIECGDNYDYDPY